MSRFFNALAFIALLATTAVGIHGLWGVLFLYWTVRSLTTGETFLITTVTRQDSPILYWLIQFSWLFLGILMLASDFDYTLMELPETMDV